MSKNTNRDYLIIVDVKSSTIKEFNKLEFYINDKESHNIFVQLVVKETHDIINKYTPIDDPNLYELTMNIVKPTNELKLLYQAKLEQEQQQRVQQLEEQQQRVQQLEAQLRERDEQIKQLRQQIPKVVEE